MKCVNECITRTTVRSQWDCLKDNSWKGFICPLRVSIFISIVFNKLIVLHSSYQVVLSTNSLTLTLHRGLEIWSWAMGKWNGEWGMEWFLERFWGRHRIVFCVHLKRRCLAVLNWVLFNSKSFNGNLLFSYSNHLFVIILIIALLSHSSYPPKFRGEGLAHLKGKSTLATQENFGCLDLYIMDSQGQIGQKMWYFGHFFLTNFIRSMRMSFENI